MRKTLTKQERCSKEVSDNTGWHWSQCLRRWTVQEDGKRWCKQHAPSSVKTRQEASAARYQAELDRKMAPLHERDRLQAINKQLLEALEDAVDVMERSQPHEGGYTWQRLERARATIKEARP